MKKKVLFIAVSLLITCSVIAQSVITIVDSINSHPLPFATILIPTQGKSYFADGNGVITITFRDKIDTLIASSVGYTPRMITSSTDTIHLIANYSILHCPVLKALPLNAYR